MFNRKDQSKAEKKIYSVIAELERSRSSHGQDWTEEERTIHQARIDDQYALLARIHRDEYVEDRGYEPGEAPKRKARSGQRGGYYSGPFGTVRFPDPSPLPMWSSHKTVTYSKPTDEALSAFRELAKEASSSESESERKTGRALSRMIEMYEELNGALESMDGVSVNVADTGKPAQAAAPAAPDGK